MSLLLIILLAFLIFGGGGYYGYRKNYYQGGGLSLVGLILFFIVCYGVFSIVYSMPTHS